MLLGKFIAKYQNNQQVIINTYDEEDAAWLAKDLEEDYNSPLVDIQVIEV